MEETTKEYTNGDITVIWKPDMCIHSAKCFKGLGTVFNPRSRPWIDMQGADSENIIKQVAQCPSGALSLKDVPVIKEKAMSDQNKTEVVVIKNGPLMVKGALSIKHKDGKEETQLEVYFCRCGQSGNKPFCDGTHKKCGFKDE
jgi:uncharacterized Fe-S cluster protein YjdI